MFQNKQSQNYNVHLELMIQFLPIDLLKFIFKLMTPQARNLKFEFSYSDSYSIHMRAPLLPRA